MISLKFKFLFCKSKDWRCKQLHHKISLTSCLFINARNANQGMINSLHLDAYFAVRVFCFPSTCFDHHFNPLLFFVSLSRPASSSKAFTWQGGRYLYNQHALRFQPFVLELVGYVNVVLINGVFFIDCFYPHMPDITSASPDTCENDKGISYRASTSSHIPEEGESCSPKISCSLFQGMATLLWLQLLSSSFTSSIPLIIIIQLILECRFLLKISFRLFLVSVMQI